MQLQSGKKVGEDQPGVHLRIGPAVRPISCFLVGTGDVVQPGHDEGGTVAQTPQGPIFTRFGTLRLLNRSHNHAPTPTRSSSCHSVVLGLPSHQEAGVRVGQVATVMEQPADGQQRYAGRAGCKWNAYPYLSLHSRQMAPSVSMDGMMARGGVA